MNWLLNIGDRDILRDAQKATTVFWHRAREGRTLVIIEAAATALFALCIVVLALGPDGTGIAALRRDLMALAVCFAGAGWAAYSGWVFFKFLPSRNDRVVLALRSYVRREIEPREADVQTLDADQLRAKTAEFKRRLADGEPLEAIRGEAYACVREASRRARNHRQFECQLIGGRVLENCNVAEMRTGEGKTIVCYLANYMKVLQGLKVHIVTVNDYLVKRDAEFCRPIFELLGVTVGYITADMDTYGPGAEVRRVAYASDITYGTNSEFGFDYLRDNMKHSARDQVQGPLQYVVVDEVDSVLIDEARTPLIISGPAHDDVSNYRVADNIARTLIKRQEEANRATARRLPELEKDPGGADRDPKFKGGLKKFRSDPFWLSSEEAEAIGHKQYFVVEMDRKSAHMTEHGAKVAQEELAIGTFYDSKNMNWPHYLDNALRAHQCYQKDKEYVVRNDVVIIVDEFTGRMMEGRQWSDGLHQAVEAKERVTIKEVTQTLATITLQNLFKLYSQLAGMTGTAMTEADEFHKIYKVEVIAIPTNQPVRRIDYNDKIYKTETNKFDAIVEEIRSYSQQGFPADPFSLADMLRTAKRALRESDDGQTDAEIGQQVALIDDALARFKDGEGDAAALEQAYEQLMAAHLGGRPLLVGTVSVENSERLSQLLMRRYGIEHEVLNAKNHAREAEIVAKAGQQHEVTRGKHRGKQGNVTIATNMAGRGTDIVLGPGVAGMGGLHVVGTERHESRRIDNQLRGRCGRQGDPGSSRFFLAMEDDLLRLFMGEWVLKMLNIVGFEEGMAIEHRQLSRGIEKAQKKVEERNFGIRKNLLEYDEVMDYQRRTFYELRQQAVVGRDLSQLIWEMMDESVDDAVTRYFDPRFPAQCVVEWAGQNLGVTLDESKLDTTEYPSLCEQIRDQAAGEVQSHLQRTIGEYIDPESPPEDWDVRGFAAWIAHYGVNLTQRQIRESDPDALLEQITTAALDRISAADLSPLNQYVDPLYPKSRLVRWAQDKFEVAVPLDELATASRDDAERIFREKIRAAYRQREIEYPVTAVLEYALQRGGSNANAVYQLVTNWVNRKYNLNWTYEHLDGKNPQQIFDELRNLNAEYLNDGRFDAEIAEALGQFSGDELVAWARRRFGNVVDWVPLNGDEDPRAALQRCAYEMLRYELTQLERMVLLTTLDAVWKDHMYSMDLLRSNIGLRGYAERDPKIEYKREGTRLFNEMMSNARERVTDLIFKVRLASAGVADWSEPQAGAAPATGGMAYGGAIAVKADATNVGFSAAAADQEAAMRQQGEGGKIQPIRREVPKVGRNDPCPCGSGKKYKQCCGKAKLA